ncbi:hypothetical protein HWV62_3148 [Athelia sp. TMB]|nr:hypothetical protein HWV62_3148 [Athelia sp. TMB]
MSQSKNVVIVGGGAAGVNTARLLSPKLGPLGYNLILIDSRPFFVHLVGSIRMSVSAVDNLEDDKVILPYDKVFASGVGELKVGTVASVTETGAAGGFVTLESGETVPYAYLVLAPGSVWNDNISFPNDRSSLKEHLATWRHKYENAQDIILAGGGSVGIETAGEIKDIWPNKNVTIVHGGAALLNDTYPAKFRKSQAAGLTARGVRLVLNDYVDDFPASGGKSAGITTRNGKKLNADLVVSPTLDMLRAALTHNFQVATTGPRPNTAFAQSIGAGVLTKQGFLAVEPTLQLKGHARIYAVGDVIAWAEQKSAAKVGGHAAVVSANILSAIQGKPVAKIYKGAIEMILVTNGKEGGGAYFGVLWGITLGAWFARMLKSRTLLVPMARGNLGLPA